MCNEYNGYSNYQTWNVALWFDNNEDTYHLIRQMADTLSLEDTSWKLTDWLKDFVESKNPLSSDASMYSDILQHGLGNVNYHEIAENIMAEE